MALRPSPHPTPVPLVPHPTLRPTPHPTPRPYTVDCKANEAVYLNGACTRKTSYLGIVTDDCCDPWVCDEKSLRCRNKVCGKEGETCAHKNGFNDGCCEHDLLCNDGNILTDDICVNPNNPKPTSNPISQPVCKLKDEPCTETCKEGTFGLSCTSDCCNEELKPKTLFCDKIQKTCRSKICGKEGDVCDQNNAFNDGCCESNLRCAWKTKVCEPKSYTQIKEQDDSDESIAKECHDKVYDVTFHAIEGPHFVIAATLPSDIQSTDVINCPSIIGFYSQDGHKQRDVAYDNGEEYNSLDEIKIGSATLDDFFKAEENAQPIDDSNYDFTKNSCVHYAGDIWRSLSVVETVELAEFIIDNVVNNDGLKNFLEEHGDTGSFRTSAMIAIGGKPAMRRFISDIVYEQLHIVDVRNEAVVA